MSGTVIGTLAAGGCLTVATRSAFRWARRRCHAALAGAATGGERPSVFLVRTGGRGLSRAEARQLAAFQQALDEERRGGRLFTQPAVPASPYPRQRR